MTYQGSYLWRLRQLLGNDLVLMPSLCPSWLGDPRPDQAEATETKFVDLSAPPEPLHSPTAHALELLAAYLNSGSFQVR